MSLALSYRRADVTGLWLIIVAVAALIAFVGASAARATDPWLWALGAAGASVAPGIAAPRWFAFGVRAWNGLTRRAATLLRGYVVAVCYYTIFLAMARRGRSATTSAQDDGSLWHVRHDRTSGSTPAAGRHDRRGLAAAARRAGNAWMFCLAPVLVLLDVLADDASSSTPPGSTYTLY